MNLINLNNTMVLDTIAKSIMAIPGSVWANIKYSLTPPSIIATNECFAATKHIKLCSSETGIEIDSYDKFSKYAHISKELKYTDTISCLNTISKIAIP